MRRLLCLIIVALAAPASASAGSVFFVDGHGWGHGIGMAQWGAYGYAKNEGRTYDWILAHYYKGTKIAQSDVTTVRVLLGEGRKTLTIGSGGPYTVRDFNDKMVALPEGSVTIGAGLTVKGKKLTSPLTFTRGARLLTLNGKLYRGKLVVYLRGGRLTVVNRVGIDEYIRGVVPDEMPPSWSPEALKAQAVAARSYAVATRKTSGIFDLYPDTRSQVYLGIAHEAPTATAAVQATAGQVVLYGGKVATTYFFSSSGGRTASAQEVFPSAVAVPYLVSVSDPYDTISPHHRWGPFVISASKLRRTLGVRGALSDVRLDLGPSGRVETITGIGGQGESTVEGWDFRRALDLDSTWFRVGVLSLGNPQAPVTYGTRVSIDGVARSMPSVRVDRRQPGTAWQTIGPVTPGPGGSVVIKAKPKLPTDYRLVSGAVRSRVAHVAVAPLVKFHGMPNTNTLRGYARPLFPGASAALQRSTGGSWRTVARGTVDQNGDFEAHVNLVPGDYRFRLAPGHGFAPGVSPTLKVGPA